MKHLLPILTAAATGLVPMLAVADTPATASRTTEMIQAEINTLDPYVPGFDETLDRLLTEEAQARQAATSMVAAN